MDLITENALGSGITLQLGNLEIYVKMIVATSGIIYKHIETAQRLPNGNKEKWGDNPTIHKQEDLYKIPSELICEILVSVVRHYED